MPSFSSPAILFNPGTRGAGGSGISFDVLLVHLIRQNYDMYHCQMGPSSNSIYIWGHQRA